MFCEALFALTRPPRSSMQNDHNLSQAKAKILSMDYGERETLGLLKNIQL